MLIQNTGRTAVVLIDLHSLDDEMLARVSVRAYLKSVGPDEDALGDRDETGVDNHFLRGRRNGR
jgi:hypothetical protein